MFSKLTILFAAAMAASVSAGGAPSYGAGSGAGSAPSYGRGHGHGGSYGNGPSYGGIPAADKVVDLKLKRRGDINDSCNSGPVQCCNQVFDSHSKESNALHALVGAVVNPVTAQAGLSCNPITAIGVGSGAQCNSQPVCCTGNHMNGLVVVGCSPVNLNA